MKAKFRTFIYALSLCLFMAGTVMADEYTFEYKIKAGYLYNFSKFITWSVMRSASFNVCIFNDNPFGSLLEPIEQRTALGLPIRLIRMTPGSAPQQCHILYIAPNDSKTFFADCTKYLQDFKSTLTVGEGDAFIEQGGLFAFVTEQSKIKLHINLTALQGMQFKVSAKLLEVAQIVEVGS